MNPAPRLKSAEQTALRWVATAVVWALCLAAFAPLQAGAQSQSGGAAPGAPAPPSLGHAFGGRQDGFSDSSPFEEAKRLRALNAERQKSLVADTEKLLRLVHELNEEIAANPADSLTPVQLRQVAEIEKLAHNVKEKMSTSVVSTPVFQQPLFPVH